MCENSKNLDYLLGKILTKIENIEEDVKKITVHDKQISEIDKDLVEVKVELREIKEIVKAKKIPWYSISSGLAAIVAIVLGIITLLNVVS